MVDLVRWHSEPVEQETPEEFSYYLIDAKSRKTLVTDVQLAVSAAFREYEALGSPHSAILDQKEPLQTALSEVNNGDPVVLVLRHRDLSAAVEGVLTALAKLPPSSPQESGFMANRSLTRAFKSATTKLRNVVHSSVGISELAKGSPFLNDVAAGKANKEESVLTIHTGSLHPEVGKQFGSQERQAQVDAAEKATQELLSTFSPDLLAAYTETRKMAWKVQKADHIAPEDMLFLEQATTDYLPKMFKALNKASARTGSPHWEAVVQECVTQFHLIQKGLQNMMEGTVLREVAAMKSQTELLRSRVARTSPALTLKNSTAFAGILEGKDK